MWFLAKNENFFKLGEISFNGEFLQKKKTFSAFEKAYLTQLEGGKYAGGNRLFCFDFRPISFDW